jgi:hypothetical protein
MIYDMAVFEECKIGQSVKNVDTQAAVKDYKRSGRSRTERHVPRIEEMLYSGRNSLDDLHQDILAPIICIIPVTAKCTKVLEGAEGLSQGD